MKLPLVRGVIDRRILANWRVDPQVIARIVPRPFRLQVVNGFAIAGICLIRLKGIRPAYLPSVFGVGSENAAHRIAVEWDDGGQHRRGVYISRRDTNSRLNVVLGGRLFPGVYHHARFRSEETDDHVGVCVEGDDGLGRISVAGRVALELPPASVFRSLGEASAFFEAGSLGYSATGTAGRYDGLELHCRKWHVQPLDMERAESSFFSDRTRFPEGTATFDCALLMRNVEHEWHGRDQLCCATQ